MGKPEEIAEIINGQNGFNGLISNLDVLFINLAFPVRGIFAGVEKCNSVVIIHKGDTIEGTRIYFNR